MADYADEICIREPTVWSVGSHLCNCAICAGGPKPAVFSQTRQLAVVIERLQTAKSRNFREFAQTGPLFVNKNAWRGPPP
jgi:hypothetical protein